jgi:hypothetical protein
MTSRRLALAIVTLVALVAPPASAHEVGISRGDYLWKDHKLWVGVAFARQELAAALPDWFDRRGADDLLGFENPRRDIGHGSSSGFR